MILALLGIEVPLNLGVEIANPRAIRKYLFWGSIVVMLAYVWVTLGTMLSLDAAKSEAATTDILAVRVGFWDSHAFASAVGIVVIWFFVSNTIVYNYSFSRAAVRLGARAADAPSARAREPAHQGACSGDPHADGAVVALRRGGVQPGARQRQTQRAYWLFQAGVTVIWCLSMVLLFADIFLVRRAFPGRFAEVRAAHPYLLYASGVMGILASAFGAYVTFRNPWTPLFEPGDWRLWLSILCGVSAPAAIAIYGISELMRRRGAAPPAPVEAGSVPGAAFVGSAPGPLVSTPFRVSPCRKTRHRAWLIQSASS